MKKIPVIVICGPTASGKTALSIEIAKKYNGEIVSADSMQIYKYMNIGTAKPDSTERDGIAHHMLDIVAPQESYSVAEYTEEAHRVIEDITSRGKTAVITGGTGLYINSLIDDVDFLENDSDTSIRNELQKIADEQGADVLVRELKSIDPASAEKIHKNNLRRIIRAIEFYKMTGIPISEHQAKTKEKESRYLPCMLAIKWDMKRLYERIEQRVDKMLENGLFDEVEQLMKNGCTPQMQSMQGIGYKETVEFLEGKISLDETISKIKQDTRHYAKRQMTWFRRDERIHWIDAESDIVNEAETILKNSGF